jgi:hypothetical protein
VEGIAEELRPIDAETEFSGPRHRTQLVLTGAPSVADSDQARAGRANGMCRVDGLRDLGLAEGP